EPIEIIGQWCREMQLITTVVGKCDRLGVQKQASQPEFLCGCIHARIPVAFISRYRMTCVQRMHANLVCAPGLRLTLHQAELAERADRSRITGDAAAGKELCQQQISFIDAHLLNWLPAFRDDCMVNDVSKFYGTLSDATVTFVERDRAWLFASGTPEQV
ncbi:MAG: hypothetical protein OQJ76_02505, partial [Rhodospirillales bacterium]|nr:hypothetical protein [Rhodospirillales bacterium]